jgi:Ca2+-binding RTX toxin-like protein
MGNALVQERGGNDRIFGGLRGNDNLLGDSGKDVVVGGTESYRRLGGNKNLVGGSGNDWVGCYTYV